MLFKLTSIALIFYVLSSVDAFGLYGGYERMFYYYAHLADAKVHGGKAQMIAAGCRKSGICDFNGFIQFVNELERSPGLKKAPDRNIHEAAQDLNERHLTGEYNIKRVYSEADDFARLFEEVSCFLDANKPHELDEIWDSARASIESVCFLRKLGFSDKLKAFLVLNNIEPVLKPEYFNCEGKSLVDENATISKYGSTTSVKNVFQKFHNDEKSHEANFKCACWAAVRLQLHRTRPSSLAGDVFQVQSDYDEECWQHDLCLKQNLKLEEQIGGHSESYRCKEL